MMVLKNALGGRVVATNKNIGDLNILRNRRDASLKKDHQTHRRRKFSFDEGILQFKEK
jgi:hypothetical protein